MAYQQVSTQPAQNGRYAGPPLDPGQTMAVRRRAVGINPVSTALFISRPKVAGIPVKWGYSTNLDGRPDGTAFMANNANTYGQGYPAIQNNGAGLRGSFTFGNPGTTPDRRVGLRSELAGQGVQSNPAYYFRLNGLNYTVHSSAGGLGTILAAGTAQLKDLYTIALYDNRVEYSVAGQLVYTLQQAAPQLTYYPCFYNGVDIYGVIAGWCTMFGKLANQLRYSDYKLLGQWSDYNLNDANAAPERNAISGQEYSEGVEIRFTKGIKIYWPQGRGLYWKNVLNGVDVSGQLGSDVVQADFNDLPVPEIGYNVLQIMFYNGSTYYTIDPQYSLLYV